MSGTITADIEVSRSAIHSVDAEVTANVEEGPVREVLRSPRHPYTRALLLARPDPGRPAAPRPIPGRPPKPSGTPDACLFRDRCALAMDRCGESLPELRSLDEAASGHRVRCWFPLGGSEEDSHG